MKLRHSQETTKKEDVKKEGLVDTKPVAPAEKPNPVIPVQPVQSATENPITPAAKPAETPTQAAPQLTLTAVQDALKQQLEGMSWIYKDSQGIDHGPYPSSKMNEWIVHGFLQADLM